MSSFEQIREKELLHCLCGLTLNPTPSEDCLQTVRTLDEAGRAQLLDLANSHHVVIRGMEAIRKDAIARDDSSLLSWADGAISQEKARIANALSHLEAVCNELEKSGCQTTVIKSLDHWPDIGNDLDLYTTGEERDVINIMRERFQAKLEPQSWGDRMAQKWNFAIPGLTEPIEIHVQRLGQMGEHTSLARRFVTRRVTKTIEGRTFFVPAPEEKLIVATLQRMYRHFYFRICDLINSAALVDSGALDFAELKKATEPSGIWMGCATYLMIVSDFAQKYRGKGLDLPRIVTTAAICGGDKVVPRARFLRVPIMPQGATLYTAQVTKAAFNGDVPATFRLGLLPYIASAAAISYKITGSDKGVW
ncbi:MAG TPA: hypothetical protein VM056_06725 [Terriglobales bacterium]|nr:hypothetical protein [Terriglobales bacterium]